MTNTPFPPRDPARYGPSDPAPLVHHHYAMVGLPRPTSTARTWSLLGLWLGISGFFFPWVINPVLGIVFSSIGIAREPRGKTIAIWGLALSIVSFVATPLTWLVQTSFFVFFLAAIGSTSY
ncbi:hypothetical protein LG314_01580 [Agrococcus terreus]|uniref:hypothetical protein n=1 Tax=Agrococcus terreus TaxID=574649 RepID=UPI00384FF036